MIPNEVIILGGGSSVAEGVSLGLWERLKGKFVIGTNYSYKHFTPTFLSYVDSSFYNQNTEDLKNLPLIIGQGKKLTTKLPNTVSLPCSSQYKRDLSNGVYCAKLTGLYSLSLAIYLIGKGNIYLLGYDFGAIKGDLDKKGRLYTHYYQNDFEHRGCFDEQTEILTVNGWKTKNTIASTDTVYSLNRNTNKIELSSILQIHSFKEHGYWSLINKHKEFIFNKNHNMFYASDKKLTPLILPLNDKRFPKMFRVPIANTPNLTPNIDFYKNWKIKPFMKLLGFWFGDGCTIESRKITSFGLNKQQSKIYLETVLQELNIKYSKASNRNRPTQNTYQIYDKDLFNELYPLGNTYTKRIPNWIFNLSSELIMDFIDGFIEADGCIRKNRKEIILISVNEQMLSQFQHLLFLCGKSSNLHKLAIKERKIENRTLKTSTIYHLTIKFSKYLYFKKKRWIDKEMSFWGVTINTNNIIFIRRNGQCMWTGNTGKVGWYCKKDRDLTDYGCFSDLKDIKIYNVSPNSNLRVFPKIDYLTFDTILSDDTYDQIELRSAILKKLEHLPKA